MMLAIVAALAVAAPGAGQPKPFFLFRIYDDVHKETLWRSDGTAAGTRPLGRHCAIEVGPTLEGAPYFVASDCRIETRLWRTDGTPLGTVALRRVLPGRLRAFQVTPSSDGALFYAATESSRPRLWRTDGTARGATAIDLQGVEVGSGICGLTSWKGLNWFWVFSNSAEEPSLGLWRSDATSGGTVQVLALPADVKIGCRLVPFGSHMYFTVKHGGFYSQLWRTDGTLSGTTLVRDFGEAEVAGLTVSGDTLYFRKLDRSGDEWWRTDGTVGHERLVKRIPWRWDQQGRVVVAAAGGTLYFNPFGRQLWKSDGTEAGTTLVKDFGSGSDDDYGEIALLGEHRGTLYLTLGASTDVTAKSLWKTDGTEKGTVFIKRVGEPVSWGKKKRK